jgi:hypothetical protein
MQLRERIEDFAGFLAAAEDEAAIMAIHRSDSTGRPAGAEDRLKALEAETNSTRAPHSGGLAQIRARFHTV